MIKVFGSTDTNFSSNGDVVIKPLKAKIRKEDNKDYYLNLETDISYADYLVTGNLIVANTPQGDQAFRISNPQKTRNKITIKAWHVFFDAKNYLIADTNIVNKTGDQAIKQLNSHTEPESEFTVSSDITTVGSYRCIRESLYAGIQKMMDKWGGHLVLDNFKIKLQSAIGVDNGVTIEYRKNLKELSCEEKWDDVVTKILPVGKDGTLLNAVNPSASIYLTSDIQYDIPYTKTVTFQQDIDKNDYQTETAYKTALVNDLRTQANDYLDDHCIPEVNYTLKANLDRITDVGDIIEVKDYRLGIDFITSVIAFEYDCLLDKYTEVEFGTFKPTLSGLFDAINNTVTQDTSGIWQALEDIDMSAISDAEIDVIVNA